jgi:hypothetical protein
MGLHDGAIILTVFINKKDTIKIVSTNVIYLGNFFS